MMMFHVARHHCFLLLMQVCEHLSLLTTLFYILCTSPIANSIMAKLTNQFIQTRLRTIDCNSSLDSDDDFHQVVDNSLSQNYPHLNDQTTQ